MCIVREEVLWEGAFPKILPDKEQMELPDKAPRAVGLGFAPQGVWMLWISLNLGCFLSTWRSPLSVKGVSGSGHSCAEKEGEKT